MATFSYTSTGSILSSHTEVDIINEGRFMNQYGSNVISPSFSTCLVYFDLIIGYLEVIYGGTITYVVGDPYVVTGNGTYRDVVFTWSGITIDPSTTSQGTPLGISLKDEDSQVFLWNWSEATSTTTTCPTCLELTKSACQTSYTFVAGLTASTDYWVVIDNNRNKRYVQQVTTDGSGDFVIDATAPEFPEGFFIPEQFTYTLKVYTTADLTTEAEITYNNTIYNCITLSFIYTVTTTGSIGAGVDLWVDDSLNFVIDDTFNTISVG